MMEERFRTGKELYGNDFEEEELAKWYAEEEEGYADLCSALPDYYGWHELNRFHGFNYLDKGVINRCLGLGSSYGLEFLPISDRLKEIYVVEPSSKLVGTMVNGIHLNYVKPELTGRMSFESGFFDLVLSFGTLHHIANVEDVVNEIGRVTAPGGMFLLREPMISMGDWTTKRKEGVTKNERGIPRHLMREFLLNADFEIVNEAPCIFPVILRMGRWEPYMSPFLTRIDALLSKATLWNCRYHSDNLIQKVRPQSLFVVARKKGQENGR